MEFFHQVDLYIILEINNPEAHNRPKNLIPKPPNNSNTKLKPRGIPKHYILLN